MDEEQINTTGPNIEVVMNLKSSGDCVPFSVTRKTTCFKNSGIVNHLRRLAGYTPEEVGLNARLYLQKRADTDGNWRKII